MISIDRVYSTVKFFINTDLRGNVKPDDLRLAINTAVEDIVEGYFVEVNRAVNRENRGFENNGLENLPDRIRERILYFLDEADLTYSTDRFALPDDIRYLDSVYYLENEAEPCKNMKEFKLISSLSDTAPSTTYPIYLRIGDDIKIVPTTIVDNVSVAYLRKHLIANWTFTVVSGTEVFNPSANDFQDIDLHSSEEYNVIIKTCGFFGVNLKESDLVNVTGSLMQQQFQQDNQV